MHVVKAEQEAKRTRGLDRAFAILDFLRLNREAANPNEISLHIGAPRSSVYEVVRLLLQNGILEPAGAGGRVFLGRKLYFLGAAYEDHFNFMHECDGMLERVVEATSETAQFCMLDGDKYTVVRMKEGSRPFRISSDVGQLVPIPWTASGRLLVAHMSDAEICDFIPNDDFTLPDGSRLEPGAFLAEVHQARREGAFTFDSIVDSFTHCFAVPVHDEDDRCVATLCIVAPREDSQRNHARYLDVLKQEAVHLRAMGLTPRTIGTQ